MYQIMKITILLLIALMLMGIQGCPSDPLTSNEVCSGQAPLFKLYVVSDTDAPFDIEVTSVGKAVHKTTGAQHTFNPITGGGAWYNFNKTNVRSKGEIINATFKPTDIHKNKGCIKEYTVEVVINASWYPNRPRTPDSPPPKPNGPLLSCEAPQGKQIKTCLFQITVNQVEKTMSYHPGGPRSQFRQAVLSMTAAGGTSRINTFANE